MDQRGGHHMKMNFEYFQIQKWMLQTIRAEKVDEKNGIICLVSMFTSWVMVLKPSKKVHFFQFCADLRNDDLSDTYMHLKGLVTHFQKTLLLIMLWLTVSEILGLEVEEFC